MWRKTRQVDLIFELFEKKREKKIQKPLKELLLALFGRALDKWATLAAGRGLEN